ncbi:3-keto-disaccharide hydrolase [Catenovulum sediminis]|uniref:DUF1080 domain-containing protein n=1 Tax=Catenovulum sediminis TaxID=1740262 RepID=A0ABV1RFN4_9ALTE|nr:DUF1080 domain-containing protein [Catenovulum sediminis]
MSFIKSTSAAIIMMNVSFWTTTSVNSAPDTQQISPQETEYWTPVPQKVNPDPVPSDAIVLFDGAHTNKWQHPDKSAVQWTLEDGILTTKSGTKSIQTKENFCDIQLHLEFKAPKHTGKPIGQRQGNSGIYIQGRYEVQILDSYDNPTYVNGQAASVYKQSPPLVNASRPSGHWQSYDIIFHAPEFNDAGDITEKATVTVLHNGVLVQDHFEIQGGTRYRGYPEYKKHGCAPIVLQNHGQVVSFRNIWVRKL